VEFSTPTEAGAVRMRRLVWLIGISSLSSSKVGSLSSSWLFWCLDVAVVQALVRVEVSFIATERGFDFVADGIVHF
jgi:hypothetical protein